MKYDITHTHFRDIYGRLLWVDPIEHEYRLYRIGETFDLDGIKYEVKRMAVVDNTQHVNVAVIEEDVNIVEPHL